MAQRTRASRASKTVGAAGLAAAILVGGLSVSPAASAATGASPIAATVSGKMVLKYFNADPYYAVSASGVVTQYSTLESAKAAAGTFSFDTGTGNIRSSSGCLRTGGDPTGNYATFGSCSIKEAQWTVNGAGIFGTYTSGAQTRLTFANGRLSTNSSGPQLATYDELFFPKSALTASVHSTDNVAKTAIVSGKATPNAKVSIGDQETIAGTPGGDWSIAVSGLSNGANSLTVIQRVYNVEFDRKTVTATIVEGGTLVPIAQGPIELTRGGTTQVPFVIQNNETRTGTKGTAVLTAPEGTTFPAQATAPQSWRAVGATNWNTTTGVPLSNGRLSNDNTTLTFDVDWPTSHAEREQYRFMINVATPAATPIGDGSMGFTFAGTSTQGAYRAQGSTTTKVSTADLTATIGDVDHIDKTALVSGTATPGAKVSIGSQETTASSSDGDWSITVTGLDNGANALTAVQRVNTVEVDRTTVTVTINDAAIIGQDGTSVTLERGTETSVDALFKTNGAVTRPQGTIEFTAPEDTTFTAGQDAITGAYKKPDGTWTSFATPITNGARSDDGTTYTYDVTTSATWNLPDASLMRWNITVTPDTDAPAGASEMRATLRGTAPEGAFTATSATTTALETTELAPIALTGPATVTPGSSNTFTGTGAPGATYRVLNISGTQIVDGTHDIDAQGNWTFNRIVSKGASNFRFKIEQTKKGQVVTSELFTINAADRAAVTVDNRAVTPGAENTFTGAGEPGATYRVLNISGTQIVGGTHDIDAQGNWTFNRVVSRGATEFRFAIEQTGNGRTERSELFTIPADTE